MSATVVANYPTPVLEIVTNLLGGISFFLVGLSKLSSGMKRLAGSKMKKLIVSLTSHPIKGLLTGMVVTGLSNSLTLVSVLLVGFVGTGLLQFESTIPVLLGAGIGSTLISLLVALKVTKYGLLLVAIGYFYPKCICGSRQPKRKASSPNLRNPGREEVVDSRNDIAQCIFGLGLIFYGSQVLGSTFGFLGTNPRFVAFLEQLHSPILGLITGFFLTVLVNSSGAAIGIFLSLSEHGLLDGRAGIAMVLGANVGTCVTACIAGLSQGRGPLEVAMALVLMRLVGAIFFTFAISGLQKVSKAVCGISTSADIALLAAEPGHVHPDDAISLDVSCQIAASHTLFNIAIAILFLPAIRPYANIVRKVVDRLLRDRKVVTSPTVSHPPALGITVV